MFHLSLPVPTYSPALGKQIILVSAVAWLFLPAAEIPLLFKTSFPIFALGWIHPVIPSYCVFSLRWRYCSHAMAPSPDICKRTARPHCEVSSTPPQPPLPPLLAKAPSFPHAPQAVLSGSVPTSTSSSNAAGWWLTVRPTGSSSSPGFELLGHDVETHTPELPLPGFCSPSPIIFHSIFISQPHLQFS